MGGTRVSRFLLLLLSIAVIAPLALGQQTGAISGRVTASDGAALPGVTVEARSNVLPQPRVTVSNETGDYRLPQLQPGQYTLTFNLAGMQGVTRNVQVLLNQTATVNVALGMAGLAESITVTAEATLVDKTSAEIQTGVSNAEIQALPISQDYKDLQKLIPGVMVTGDEVRGPSGGGSGQDNVYLFDGVNVTMPLFGVTTTEPATHDIAQVNVVKGGAQAIDFERSAGFTIDSVSKSGTNQYSGEVGFQILNHNFIADQEGGTSSRFEQDRSWTTANVGGPIVQDRLFFYGSYYRPVSSRDNQANRYGELPDYKSTRNEYFGKATFTPTQNWLINASYRNSRREETGNQFANNVAATTGLGYETSLKIGVLETSWIINPSSFATFKYTDFRNPGRGRADVLAGITPSIAVGSQLDLGNLGTIGRLVVPTVPTNPEQAAFVQPYIDRYGYLNDNGVRTGGGIVGFSQFAADDDSFYRKAGQLGYNLTVGSAIAHDLHFGYQKYEDSEDRFQTSNGWGVISIPAGNINCPAAACGVATPAFFTANFSQQTTGAVPTIHSEFHSQNIELNDTIRWNNWSFNVGVLASNDTYYGQGLAPADNIAGFVKSPGRQYKMYDLGFSDMIQPRLGATWAYNGTDTVYASYAKYNPAASSLPRAASWDRNLVASINAYFDASGKLIGVDPVRSSSGKLFVDNLKPRETNEFLIGTGQQITPAWSARAYGRYRKTTHFWEDTNNDARIAFGAGVEGVPQELYIPDLAERLKAIGSGSTYVIAELDGAFTKYYEATMESEWRHGNTSVTGSYTWSHYYGNFDQDNSTFNSANDQATFIGSSNIGDGAGRQLWDYKYGDLRGDRRNILKLRGVEMLPWNASVGTFFFYQSGAPYQIESYIPYKSLTRSTSDTNRYAEPAGRRRTPAHHQMDLNYTQNLPSVRGVTFQLVLDVFNLYNNQTGRDYETRVGTLGLQPLDSSGKCSGFATGIGGDLGCLKQAPYAKTFYDPRRFQLAARIQF